MALKLGALLFGLALVVSAVAGKSRFYLPFLIYSLGIICASFLLIIILFGGIVTELAVGMKCHLIGVAVTLVLEAGYVVSHSTLN